jgi:hypothetical protein
VTDRPEEEEEEEEVVVVPDMQTHVTKPYSK